MNNGPAVAKTDVPLVVAPAVAAQKRYQIGVQNLQIGMFVAELDRPWLDTPFLLQGFLVDSQVELDTLRRYCKYVFVDLDLSNPEVGGAIREADRLLTEAPPTETRNFGSLRTEPQATVTGSATATPPKPVVAARSERPARIRTDVKVSNQTRERFRQFVKNSAVAADEGDGDDSLTSRAWGWLKDKLPGNSQKQATRAMSKADAASIAEIKSALPADIKLKKYNERHAIDAELPRARTTFARSEKILTALVEDVRSGKIPQVSEVRDSVDDMVDSIVDNPDALMWVARLREEDLNTYSHGVKVALYMIALGRHLGFPKRLMSTLGMIGTLADVGKTKLPRALLEKPGMLTPSEFAIVKEHVRLGLELLQQSMELPEEVEQGIAQHHERLDGSGYPKGLSGDEISIYGRIAAIADSFAALITPRAYANPLAPQEALMSLYEWAGTSFHEPLVEQFVQAIGVFPVGSLVELSTGEVAVVLAHNRVRRLEPKVLVLTASDKRPISPPVQRDLLRQPRDEDNKPIRIVRGLAAGAYGLKLRDFYGNELAASNNLL